MPAEPTTLVPLQPAGNRPPLYCVHPASGSVYCYSGLARLVGPEQPVLGLEAPGLEGERPPATSVDELVEAHLAALPPAVAGGAVRLLGWSLGGVLAFELANRLRAAGTEVAALIMIDCPVPRWDQRPPEADILRRFLMESAGGQEVSDAQVAELARTLETSGPVDPDDDAALELAVLRSRYAVFRANTEALVAHRVTRVYPGPVQLIRAERSPADYMRWNEWAEQVTTHVLPGDHMSIWAGESLDRLAATVVEILAKTGPADAG